MNQHYDYIIAGMGCAGLSLAVALSDAGLSKDKKILLIDREQKSKNDRTWCFWEKEAGRFEEIIFRKWNAVNFHAADYSECLDLTPYSYKMIKGADFYRYCIKKIEKDSAFEIKYSQILSIKNENGHVVVNTNELQYAAPFVFNSILFKELDIRKKDYHLLQHFKGYFIKSEKEVFNKDLPTLMDFRISQQHGTSFIYTMPFSNHEALVEYTVFSESILKDEIYDLQLDSYLRELAGTDWTIIEKEFGVIPMTNYPFKRREGNILQIGTMGGMTKPSSGYTFTFIQRDTENIISSIKRTGHPFALPKASSRFLWYDSVLLNVLSKGKPAGATVFSCLFKNNKTQDILEFLDNQSSPVKEVGIISTLPQIPFMQAGFQELWKKIF